MTNQEFINAIAPIIQKYAAQFGFGVPSAIIAQACLESAYGTSGKAQKNNFFGMKYRAGRVSCNSGYFSDTSTEEYSVGVYTPISTDWYSFADMDSGVKGYFEFIQNGPYASARAVSQTEHKLYLAALKTCGYATSSKYVENNEAVISKWNLTQYDDISGAAETKKEEETKVSYQYYDLCNAKSVSYGSSRPESNIKYIVLHYTGNTNDTAKANCNYFATSNTRSAGAHYFVDGTSVYHSIADTLTAWSVGGSKYSNCGSTGGGKLYGICTNFNSVSIEMCSTNGAISEATLANAAELTKSLMQKYNIDADHVIRHFDVTGKSCPGYDSFIGSNPTQWNDFKNRLSGAASSGSTAAAEKEYELCVIGKITVVTAVNFRQWPKASDEIHVWEVLPQGAEYDVIDVWNHEWFRLKVNGHYGYVHKSCVSWKKYYGTDANVYIDYVQLGTVDAPDGELNVRAWRRAADEVAVLDKLKNGDEVKICDGRKDEDGDLWYLVKMKDHYGFVYADYVK